jgi:hypothetical protein
MRVLPALLLVAGCATRPVMIGSEMRPRMSYGYSDRNHLYSVELRDAYPATRGPSSGLHAFAASVDGNICGTNIAYDAMYFGRFMSVTGFATDIYGASASDTAVIVDARGDSAMLNGEGEHRPVTLEVRDVVSRGVGERHVSGSIGEILGVSNPNSVKLTTIRSSNVVDLRFNPTMLAGQVGVRNYDLRREDDDLVGSFKSYGRRIPFALHGAAELWMMPPAAQAAILPLLLSCGTPAVLRVAAR